VNQRGTILFAVAMLTASVSMASLFLARDGIVVFLLLGCLLMQAIPIGIALAFREWAKKLPSRTQWMAVAQAFFFFALAAFFAAADQGVFIEPIVERKGESPDVDRLFE
jgi:hypothetical protein